MSVDSTLITTLVRDSLAKGNTPQLTIISGSMRPLLQIGDRVVVERCAVEQLRVGDIVVVNSAEALYTHRLRAMLEHEGRRYLITRGDRPLAYDPPWDSAEFVGRITARIRAGQRLDLRTGHGNYLNRYLAWCATIEEKIFTLGRLPLDWQTLAQPEGRQLARGLRRTKAGTRFLYSLRGGIYLWYRLLVAIVERVK